MGRTTVVVLGATGSIGSAVVTTTATKYPNISVIAGVRDPAKAAKLVVASNVTLKQADLSKPDTLTAVVQGADIVFINTPGHIDRTQLAINGVNAAKAAGVKHIIVVSVLTADHSDTIFGKQFAPIEAHVKAAGVRYTLLRLPIFIDNNWGNAGSIKNQGQLYGASIPENAFTPITIEDIAEFTALVIHDASKHNNKTYKLTGHPYNHNELAAAFAKHTKKQVNYVQVPYEGAKQAMLGLGYPEWQVDGINELYQLIDKKDAVYTYSKDFKHVTGHEPTTLDHWVSQVAAAFQ